MRGCFVVMALLIAGCAVGPDFKHPDTPKAQWHAPLPHGGKVENLLRWWEQWNDTTMTQLIEQAEKRNPTLDMAVARLAAARANAGVSEAASYPSVGASVGATRSKTLFGNQVLEMKQSSYGLDAGWEIDLFGRVRRGQEAARARMQASEAGWHEARISLAAEVAGAYVELRTCEAGVVLAEKELASRRLTLDLTELRRGAGFASTSEWARSKAAWEEAQAAQAARLGDCARQLNSLVALTGLDYAKLQELLQAGRGKLPAPEQIALDAVAARALRLRPDIFVAESEWAAASADIGVAKAEIFPSFSLLGSIGLSRLVMAGAATNTSTWSFGPNLNIPVFDGGGTSGQVKAAQTRYAYAEANYRRTVLSAVKEIEDALVRLDVANKRSEQHRAALEQYKIMLQAGNERRDAGMANQLSVEEMQRTTWLAEDNMLGGMRDSARAWIALYKALGGGWQLHNNGETGE